MNNNDKRKKLLAPGRITEEDIEKAVRKDPNNCALAQAFKRVNPGAEVIVNLSEGMVWVNGLASTIGPSINLVRVLDEARQTVADGIAVKDSEELVVINPGWFVEAEELLREAKKQGFF